MNYIKNRFNFISWIIENLVFVFLSFLFFGFTIYAGLNILSLGYCVIVAMIFSYFHLLSRICGVEIKRILRAKERIEDE